MGKQYLIDSNSVIDYMAGVFPPPGMEFMNKIIDDIPVISVITKIEILGFKTTQEAGSLMIHFVEDSMVIGLADEIVEKTIELRKDHKIKIPDAIIASTALLNEFCLISRNEKDFKDIKGLVCINPYKI